MVSQFYQMDQLVVEGGKSVRGISKGYEFRAQQLLTVSAG